MTETQYTILERFSIISDSEGDTRAFQIIAQTYGSEWVKWLTNIL